jgi:hypothetical protein
VCTSSDICNSSHTYLNKSFVSGKLRHVSVLVAEFRTTLTAAPCTQQRTCTSAQRPLDTDSDSIAQQPPAASPPRQAFQRQLTTYSTTNKHHHSAKRKQRKARIVPSADFPLLPANKNSRRSGRCPARCSPPSKTEKKGVLSARDGKTCSSWGCGLRCGFDFGICRYHCRR